MTTADILFISHGGGPLPLLGDPGHEELMTGLPQIAAQIPRPDAILIISAHWEARVPTVTAAVQPPLIYDYHGFPPESYQIQYPCLGSPALASAVVTALDKAGLNPVADSNRGLDHGVFVPLTLMYPAADIPCVQLSLVKTLAADIHLAMGEALRRLEFDGRLLILGSGFSFHNMRAFFAPDLPEIRQQNLAFEQWLETTCRSTEFSEAERLQRLQDWSSAPSARFCHPREEHLMPLHVCYGAAGRPCDELWRLQIMNKQAGQFYWGGR